MPKERPLPRRAADRARSGIAPGGRRGAALVVVLLALGAPRPTPLAAQATAYVDVADPAYDDLNVLVANGLVREIMVGERPYSEAAFRRFVEEAGRRAADGSPRARVGEALERLAGRFGEAARRPALALAAPRLDLALADSPDRPYRSGERMPPPLLSGKIAGAVNPLLQRNEGEVLDHGATAAVQAGVVGRAGVLAGAFVPRVALGLPRGPAPAHLSAVVADAYVRAVVGPVAVDVGRNNLVTGFGADGGPMLSDNARGLDVLRLAADRPLRLPSVLGRLGAWQASIGVADLGDNRTIPGSKLLMIRGSGRPSPFLEFGIGYVNQQGGTDSPSAGFGERLVDLFVPWTRRRDYLFSDKVVGADVRISVPKIGSALYVNFMTTDDRGRFQQPACGCWEDAVWLVGVEALGLGGEGRTDVRLEGRHAGPRAHIHHQFTSGMTIDGRTFGDALGPNAAALSAAVERTGPASRVGVTAAWERYSGDDWYWDRIPGGGAWDYEWYRLADNPDEVRVRLVVDWLRRRGGERLETRIRGGYEHVTRFDFTSAGRDNLLALVSLRYLW